MAPAMGGASSAATGELNFDLVNDTGSDLLEVFIWPSGRTTPRDEVLFGQTLGPGEVVEITLPNRAGICDHDLLFVLEGGETIEDTADLCATDVLALQR